MQLKRNKRQWNFSPSISDRLNKIMTSIVLLCLVSIYVLLMLNTSVWCYASKSHELKSFQQHLFTPCTNEKKTFSKNLFKSWPWANKIQFISYQKTIKPQLLSASALFCCSEFLFLFWIQIYINANVIQLCQHIYFGHFAILKHSQVV